MQSLSSFAKEAYRHAKTNHPSLMRLVRFVISGGTATFVNLSTLYILTHYFGVWYLYSSIAAFTVSFFVSFTLQKFWTFENKSIDGLHVQATLFLTVILAALAVNTFLIYVFVEYMHAHYLIGQLVSGLFIAIMNFLGYKHFVFHERSSSYSQEKISIAFILFLSIAIGLFLCLSLYRLSENPPTWLDEGIITQVAINLAENGTYAIQTAPGQFIPTAFLTTSFPVIYPISVSFLFFGTTILSARLVMVIFMALVCVLSYLLIRHLALERKRTLALSTLLLLVTFAPLYGHGKNVLGEVPGLMFFLASLITLHFALKRSDVWPWILSGIFLGLSMATKPIYLFIIAPSALLVLLIHRSRFSFKKIAVCIGSALSILMLWFFIHIGNLEALQQILLSANTENAPLADRFVRVITQFVSELQPMYFLALLGIWCVSIILRARRGIEISSVELFAALFSLLNLALYLVSRGFYRYFFPAEMLALIFLPLALYSLPLKKYRDPFLKGSAVFIVLLVLFQGYQTFFSSWISEFKESSRSALLSEHLRDIPADKSIFLYNVPEAVIFLPSQNYYQYLTFGENVIRGEENLSLLFEGTPDVVLADHKFPDTERLLRMYRVESTFDKYTLYIRKNP